MNIKRIQNASTYRKKVFLRVDMDVSIQNGKILDETRLEAWFPTLEYLLKNQAQVYLAGHMGRPKPISNFKFQISNENEKLSLEPVARWILKKLELSGELKLFDLNGLKGFALPNGVSFLENLRFFKEEEENNLEFAKKLASLADIYVNDAFASSHRAHASIVAITKLLPSYAGFRLLKEVQELEKILVNPKRPLCVIIGGAKIETKLPLVEKMHKFADYVLVGGEIAENDKVLLKVAHERVNPPAGGQKSALLVADLTPNTKDITVKSAENFVQIIQNAKTIVWNGPMGLVEEEENAKGTEILAKGLENLSAYKIVGGGDTVSYLKKENLLDKFDFVSIGGGAMLEFLAGETLPGLAVLKE